MHAYEMHAREMHALEMHAREMRACEMHACECTPVRIKWVCGFYDFDFQNFKTNIPHYLSPAADFASPHPHTFCTAQMSARITDYKPQVYRTYRPCCRLNDTTGASELGKLSDAGEEDGLCRTIDLVR
jgi:hypothetical protein